MATLSSFMVRVYIYIFFNFYLFIYLFIHLWLCWVFVSVRGLSLVAASGGHPSSRCAGLSPQRPLLLRSTGSRRAGSAIVAHGRSCSAACGILPDQGSNPRPLHQQADSQPLRHQGSPGYIFNETFTILLIFFFFKPRIWTSPAFTDFLYNHLSLMSELGCKKASERAADCNPVMVKNTSRGLLIGTDTAVPVPRCRGDCVTFPGLPQQSTTHWLAEATKIYCFTVWGHKSKMKVSAGPCSLQRQEARISSRPLFQLSDNSLVQQHNSSLYRVVSLCVSVSKFPLQEDTSHFE